MIKKLFTLIVLLLLNTMQGQESFDLGFDSNKKSVYDVTTGKETIIPVEIIGKNISKNFIDSKCKFSVETDSAKTVLPYTKILFNNRKSYEKTFSEFKKDKSKIVRETVYISIKPDSVIPEKSNLTLKLIVKDSLDRIITDENTAFNKTIVLNLESGSNAPYSKYKNLSYIGTNFDLVEGVKAQNLFFATNVLSHPSKNSKTGFYLSLYGNRAMSNTENIDENYITTEVIPLDSIQAIRVRKMVSSTRTTTTDNIGAHFSTLHPIFGTLKSKSEFKTYFTASIEFIWKRTNILTEYGEVKHVDSTLSNSSIRNHLVLNSLQPSTQSVNEYAFHLGPGIFLALENDDISIRIHHTIGYASNYFLTPGSINSTEVKVEQKKDIFYTGRAWITEPKTGLTLQAEINNQLENPRPFYVVTLSKAFKLDKLAGFFSPVTAR